MAKKSVTIKSKRPVKHSTQTYTRRECCGRPHPICRELHLRRTCFRRLTYKGQIPGVKKASW